MAVCVIGGSGFIGTRLVSRLEKSEIEVVIIDKEPSRFHNDIVRLVDICDITSLAGCINEGDVIVNLAAEHRDDVFPRERYYEVNVGGARNICAVARAKGCTQIVFTSSVAVYGEADLETPESGRIAPFNDYGRSKAEAETVFREWYAEDPEHRSLVIVRPTVVFGERNRGNVYNLLKHIHSGHFIMIGSGQNRKSLAYVENVAAFLEMSISLGPGFHLFNYIDKPDFEMNDLVALVHSLLGRRYYPWLRLPRVVGKAVGLLADGAARVSGKRLPISAVRVKKFCLDSVYSTAIGTVGFRAPVDLETAIRATVRFEFLEAPPDDHVFYSE